MVPMIRQNPQADRTIHHQLGPAGCEDALGEFGVVEMEVLESVGNGEVVLGTVFGEVLGTDGVIALGSFRPQMEHLPFSQM